MKTHHRLILSIIAISVGIFLIGSGIFEPEELFIALNIPHSAGKYMAFGGMGILGWGLFQMVTLLKDRQRTLRELVSWAQGERMQATIAGIACVAIGAILTVSLIWSFISVMQTGSPIRVRPVPIGFGIGLGGLLIWLGGILIKATLGVKSKSE